MLTALINVVILISSTPRQIEVPVDRLAVAALRSWDVTGCAIVVVTPDQTIYLKGHGVRELGKAHRVSPDTAFPLASCSKAFTTTLAAMLADEGKLNWDDRVSKHLEYFHLSDPAADKLVALRDLASHRTGVAANDMLWYRAPFPQDDLVRRMAKLPLARPFRTEMQYQSVMYIALGQALAKAGGQSWADLVTERILKPLRMTNATLTTTAALKGETAAGHRLDNDGKLITMPWYEQPEPNAAGSVNASARDLAPWLQLHLNAGKLGDRQLVSAKRLRETHMPHIVIRMDDSTRSFCPETNQMSYGLGWNIQDYRGHLVVQHAGLIDGFRAHLTILPNDGYAFAILANRQGTRMNLALSNSLVDLLLGMPAKDWNKILGDVVAHEANEAKVQARREDLARRPGIESSIPFAKLAGVYEEPAYGQATVRLGKNGLIWEWGKWKLPLEHYGGDAFRLQSDNEYFNRRMLHFDVVDGKPSALRLPGLIFRRQD